MSEERSGCSAWIWRLFGSQSTPQAEVMPYKVRRALLSPAELSFYHVLYKLVKNRVVILSKIRLADVFYVENMRSNYSYFGRISQKHVDFVLCDPKTMKPICAIELDDKSHNSRQKRDQFVDDVFKIFLHR